jgi:hypothetical protein
LRLRVFARDIPRFGCGFTALGFQWIARFAPLDTFAEGLFVEAVKLHFAV